MPRLVGTTTATIKHMTEQVCDQRPEPFLRGAPAETTTTPVVCRRHLESNEDSTISANQIAFYDQDQRFTERARFAKSSFMSRSRAPADHRQDCHSWSYVRRRFAHKKAV